MISISFTEKFDNKNVEDMSYFLAFCDSVESIDLSKINTMNLLYVEGMFLGCVSLTSINFWNFTTRKITTMRYIFAGCQKLSSIDLSNFKTNDL